MSNKNYTRSFMLEKTPAEVFNAINDVKSWWSSNMTGNSEKRNDVFDVQFADIHYSEQKLIEVVRDKKVVWLVTTSNLSFLQKKDEWNDTTIVFDIAEVDGKTQLDFTHIGLVSEIECFNACSGGWDYYLDESLIPFINTGIGKPNTQ